MVNGFCNSRSKGLFAVCLIIIDLTWKEPCYQESESNHYPGAQVLPFLYKKHVSRHAQTTLVMTFPIPYSDSRGNIPIKLFSCTTYSDFVKMKTYHEMFFSYKRKNFQHAKHDKTVSGGLLSKDWIECLPLGLVITRVSLQNKVTDNNNNMRDDQLIPWPFPPVQGTPAVVHSHTCNPWPDPTCSTIQKKCVVYLRRTPMPQNFPIMCAVSILSEPRKNWDFPLMQVTGNERFVYF